MTKSILTSKCLHKVNTVVEFILSIIGKDFKLITKIGLTDPRCDVETDLDARRKTLNRSQCEARHAGGGEPRPRVRDKARVEAERHRLQHPDCLAVGSHTLDSPQLLTIYPIFSL